MEMEQGGKLFFDLFVAMCNHMVCFLFPNSARGCLADTIGV